MQSMKRVMALAIALVFQFILSVYGQDISSYLITNDIGSFTVSGDPLAGKGPGMLAGTDHFYQDHTDMTFELDYFNLQTKVSTEVQVTNHADSTDAIKWLLHEVECNFRRNPEQDRFKGIVREINGNRIFTYVRGTHYSWISNNIVVDIRYTDLHKTKPEPIEIITAYLQKFPSTMPPMIMDITHDVQWIKDEMDRRLWLCDKWFMQLQLEKADAKQVYQESVKSMSIFHDYREKYYGIKAADEKNLLAGYLSASNGTGIKTKLAEYKNWWAVNKERMISL